MLFFDFPYTKLVVFIGLKTNAMSEADLNIKIENWFKENYDIKIKFNSRTVVDVLTQLNVLKTRETEAGRYIELIFTDQDSYLSQRKGLESFADDLLQDDVLIREKEEVTSEEVKWK